VPRNEDCAHPAAYCDLTGLETKGGIGVCLFDFEAEAGARGVACTDVDAAINDAAMPNGVWRRGNYGSTGA
jgi:hypothetical protein